MKILLFGAVGQVGWELRRSLAPLGNLVALQRDRNANPNQWCGDLSDLQGLADTVRRACPDVIVNAAAYTAVDKAESDETQARQVNALAPAALAQEAAKLGAWLVHYSTDYVFDGGGTKPWTESDACDPINVYGQTKWEGELAVADWARHLILRTSWVYGARGGNFAKTMLRLAMTKDTLKVIDDQFGAPTGADLLADVTSHMLRQVLSAGKVDAGNGFAGTYNVAASGHTSWHDYARFVIDRCRNQRPDKSITMQSMEPVASAAFVSAALRPLNSRLDTHKLRNAFGLNLPSWQEGVARMLTEIDYDYSR